MSANVVVLNLPERSSESTSLHDRTTLRRLVDLMVEVWEPDWATLSSPALRALRGDRTSGPVIGWFTYFAVSRGQVPELHPPFDVRFLPNGTMIEITDDCVLPSDVVGLERLLCDLLAEPAMPESLPASSS